MNLPDIFENQMPVGYFSCFEHLPLTETDAIKLLRLKTPFQQPKPIHYQPLMSLEEERLATAVFDLTSRTALDIYEENLKLHPKWPEQVMSKREYHDLDRLLEESLFETAAIARERLREANKKRFQDTNPLET